jgi:hypothetical protein
VLDRAADLFLEREILIPAWSRLLARLQKYREQADYDTACVFTVDDVREEMKEAGEFIVLMKKHLADGGLPGKS